VTEQDDRDITQDSAPDAGGEDLAGAEAPELPAPEQIEPEAVAPEPETVEAEPAQPEAEPAQPDAAAPAPEAAPAETPEASESSETAEASADAVAEEEAPRSPAELAADARYSATGKRKSSVARVILKPGTGDFLLNGRPLEVYFPRRTHQAVVKQPLEAAGFVGRVDVVARIHGGGISGQADAVRHGIAKALIEADPALRGELKRRQLLTRDPRVKERRKAGLKKARKRPQFSKR
jgi:small subunit ribosomal protein S9